MDDSSHSVYLAADSKSTWEAFANKTRNGGACTGESLGQFAQLECNNLDTAFSASRIRCVRYDAAWLVKDQLQATRLGLWFSSISFSSPLLLETIYVHTTSLSLRFDVFGISLSEKLEVLGLEYVLHT